MAEVHLPHAAHDPGEDNPEVHHETSDVNINGILTFAAGLIVVAIVIHVVIWLLFQYFNTREAAKVPPEYPLAITQEQRLPPEPRLQTNPRQDLRDLHVAEEDVLKSYGWVDKNAGVVRIPIEDAMKIVVERGLPTRQQQGERR
jgi:hypothetical protein